MDRELRQNKNEHGREYREMVSNKHTIDDVSDSNCKNSKMTTNTIIAEMIESEM